MPTASGPFDVTTKPQKPEEGEYAHVARLLLDKTFHGDLDATSRGEMLAIGGDSGWGVYVALDKVVGTLAGRSGSFSLYHAGTMTKAGQSLNIRIVPESGTEELAGISGSLDIKIDKDGAHSYVLVYELPK